MADNVQLTAGAGGDVAAADDIAGVKYQRIKLIHGADGSNDGDVASANPLPVGMSSTTLAGSTVVVVDYDSGVGSVPLQLIGVALPASGGPVAGGTPTNPISVRAVQSTAGDLNVTVAGYVAPSTTVAVSTGSVRVHQSSAADLNVTVAGYVAPSTVVSVSTGSIRVHQSTAADHLVTVYQSTAAALQATVTPAAGSTWSVRPLQSSASNLLMTAYQSTAADLNVTVAGYVAPSTIVTVSTGSIRVHQSTAANHLVTVYQSTAADQLVTVYQSTAAALQATVRLNTSSGGALEGSTAAPAAGVIALAVREVLGTILSTTVLVTSTASTALYTLVSSAANVRHKVFAYAVTSTHTRPSTLVFVSSNANDKWALQLGSGSSGITGANLAIAPPAWLFHTEVNEALRVRFEDGSSAASTQVVRVSIAYITLA